MDRFYEKIQTTLMRLNSEHELKDLSSHVTQESADKIDSVISDLAIVFKNCEVNTEEVAKKDDKCVKALQYLIFNTNFHCQDQMAEDIVNGHLVDMCPALAPYLLLTITYKFNYEIILTELALYCPLELCVEIMEITPRCLNIMKFERAQKFIISFILNTYKKLVLMKQNELQSLELNETLDQFNVQFQELVAVIKENKTLRIDELTENNKLRRGFIIKDVTKLILDCLECHQTGVKVDPEEEKQFKITFGREFVVKCDPKLVEKHLSIFNSCLLSLMSSILQEVDVNTYMEWVEFDSPEDPSQTLQQSVRFDCYKLLDFLKKSQLKLNVELLKCLEHLAAKPKQPSDLGLEELCREVAEGSKESLKQLTSRYQQWNENIFLAVKPHYLLFDKQDCSFLLEYLTILIENNLDEDHKQSVYNLVTKVLLKLEITEVFEVALEYIKTHEAKNILESVNTQEMFNDFITTNTNFKDPMKLRILLFFIMKNPKEFLMTLIKMSIGSSQYPHVMIPPEDLLLLAPIMRIEDETGVKLVLSILLVNIRLKKTDWKTVKFCNFITTMIDRVFTADELTNVVFIPIIEDSLMSIETVKTVLICLQKIMPFFTENINFSGLLIALATKMKSIRRNKRISRCESNEMLNLIIKIVRTMIVNYKEWVLKIEKVNEIIKIILPIDQIYFEELLSYNQPPDITDIIRDYSRRVVAAIAQVFEDTEAPELDLNSLWVDFKFNLILNSTEEEFVRIATEIAVIHADFFHPQMEEVLVDDAVLDFMNLVARAWSYCLEIPRATQPNTFGCLIRSQAKFIKLIMRIKNKTWEYEKILNALKENVNGLSDGIKETGYGDCYEKLIESLERPSGEESLESILQIAESLETFGSNCLQNISAVLGEKKVPRDLMKLLLAQEFIDNCLSHKNEP
ncbi:hypothetical protein KQX54_005314 [Cotesia glomerata]|uniref:Uncharacterized protein n=1 Tax=Cotesia glomerata TaxID=32391 RepID=A0AAV7IBC8_COTGL|nr:hypothetical protein KQX54_005314 [Cotesia glomerata]